MKNNLVLITVTVIFSVANVLWWLTVRHLRAQLTLAQSRTWRCPVCGNQAWLLVGERQEGK